MLDRTSMKIDAPAVPAIEVANIGRRYADVEAVNGLSFTVNQGEFFALLGPNGAGKSTLLHMMTTLVTPTSGTARVMGFDVITEPKAVRWKLGMVFQDPALDDRLTAAENLQIHAVLYGVPRAARKAAVEEGLAWASLAETGKRRVAT